jgi:hypothetical protein
MLLMHPNYRRCLDIMACLLIALVFFGCQAGNTGATGIGGIMKDQGVYTTLAVTGRTFDLPPSQYEPKASFGPGETPVAVILGYGNPTRPQILTLELMETDTGRTLLSEGCCGVYGKALTIRLSIHATGKYKLRLTAGETELDTWQFTVTR